jgi:hypothetical protein
MKPNIIKWTHLALAFLILTNLLNIIYHPFFIFRYSASFDLILPTIIVSGDSSSSGHSMTQEVSFWNYPILPFVIVITGIITVIGLIKSAPWSRVAAYVLIGVAAIEGIGASIYFVVSGKDSIADQLHTLIIFDILLLFLAYKIYTSKPLKDYLSN